MKKVDWFILSIVLVAIVGTSIWYFLFYKKSSTADSSAGSPSQAPEIKYDPGKGLIPPTITQMAQGDFPLKKGDRNRRVYGLQVALNAIVGTSIDEDGIFGDQTLGVLKQHYSGMIQVTEEFAGVLYNQVQSKSATSPSALIALSKIKASF